MHKDSIPWTAFTCPQGHFEWKVMPFGLKNAPSVYQRRMDEALVSCKDFTITYIDDVLVFSKTKTEHIGHLKLVFSAFMQHGIILSKKKMQLGKQFIKFLGVEIGNGRIKLQDHIATKILAFPDKLEDTKILQQFLGLVNQARPFIKNLSKIKGPLYGKTSPKGVKSFNKEDIKIVRLIKDIVINLPSLKLPLQEDYLIVETDGCETGWGAVLLRKPHKYSPKDSEEICRYSSGKFEETGYISSIDAELLAITYALEHFVLFLMNKKDFLIRTDCEAIVKFYKNKDQKRSHQKRWVKFLTALLNRRFYSELEHIKGNDNKVADILSRLVYGEERYK